MVILKRVGLQLGFTLSEIINLEAKDSFYKLLNNILHNGISKEDIISEVDEFLKNLERESKENSNDIRVKTLDMDILERVLDSDTIQKVVLEKFRYDVNSFKKLNSAEDDFVLNITNVRDFVEKEILCNYKFIFTDNFIESLNSLEVNSISSGNSDKTFKNNLNAYLVWIDDESNSFQNATRLAVGDKLANLNFKIFGEKIHHRYVSSIIKRIK